MSPPSLYFFSQGSTCVYSRKVEHVHQLVLRTIDFLTQQKQQQQNRGGGGDGSKGDDVSGEGDVSEQEYFCPQHDVDTIYSRG